MALTNHAPQAYAPPDYYDWNWPGIRLVQAHGCNCQEGVAALEAAVRTYSDSPDRQRTLTILAELKQVKVTPGYGFALSATSMDCRI